MPNGILRTAKMPLETHEWKQFLARKVNLASWIAIHRTEIPCDSRQRLSVVELLLKELRLSCDVVREDIPLDDERLLSLIRTTVESLNRLEWHADAQWALGQWQSGAFDGLKEDYVAIYLKQVRGFGCDPVALRNKWATKFGVQPQRIIIDYIGTEE